MVLFFERSILAGLSWVVLLVASVALTPVQAAPAENTECVILLHGLARTSASMDDMAERLNDAGYVVANIDYPSREFTIDVLAPEAIDRGLAECDSQVGNGGGIHFVTHSMGGILVRQYLSTTPIENIARVVMLAPPNHGSEVVDNLRDVPGFQFLNGPAGQQLGTEPTSVPNSLGPIAVDAAVIAGTYSINLVLSNFLPDPDDGKVSVASARLDGMCAMLLVDVSHPFIMEDDNVIDEVLSYLDSGKFIDQSATRHPCTARP